ncbi:hypothetical protein Salat_2900900 [Sesamum alatum]|uniref:Uncharacterized protein n=1 Tax=Sesamum alatum TaxID=300844 RepID=A0AAE1XIS9_9LAMI|nr:hypothetical protein Salat_2900900 [Sesamum alatum]
MIRQKVPDKVVRLRIMMCLVHASAAIRFCLGHRGPIPIPVDVFVDARGYYCGTFQWVDPPMCRRSKEVIPGLLNRISQYESEVKRANERVGEMQEVVRHHQHRLRWALVSWTLTVMIILSLLSLRFL